MTTPCLFIEDDLSQAALSVAGRCESWRAPASADEPGTADGEASLAEIALQRAANLAAWTRERLGRGQPLRLCVGVKRAVCERVRAPSPAPAIVAAALAQRDEDAADRLAALTIEPIQAPSGAPAEPDDAQEREPARFARFRAMLDRSGRGSGESAAVTVMEAPTAGIRLAMDALERAGRPVEDAITLWHALLLAYPSGGELAPAAPGVNGEAAAATDAAATPAPTRAVMHVDLEGGVVWAWGRGRALLTGGCLAPRRSSASSGTSLGARAEPSSAGEPPSPSAASFDCSRLLLDWLSWSAQLETSPAHIAVVSAGAAEICQRLKQAWPDAAVQPIETDEPALETLRRLTAPNDDAGGAAAAEPQPRPAERDANASPPSRFEALTRRPSRRRRRAGLWWSAAMTLAAAAAVIDGGRNLLAGAALRNQADEARAEVRNRALELELSATEARMPVRSLLSRLQTAETEFKPPTPPPPPRPIRAEIRRFVAAVDSVEGAMLERISLETNSGLATVTVPSIEVGERVQLAVRQSQGRVRWSSQFVGVAPAMTLRFTPSWESFQ